MPNWVENELQVKGPPADLKRFMAFAVGPAGNPTGRKNQETSLLSADKFIPYPREYYAPPECGSCGTTPGLCKACEEQFQKLYNEKGYEWAQEHWGTKWGLDQVTISTNSPDKGHIGYAFLTAWSPPSLVIRAMAEKFPALTFDLKYWEGGANFQGELSLQGTRLLKNTQRAYRGSRGG